MVSQTTMLIVLVIGLSGSCDDSSDGRTLCCAIQVFGTHNVQRTTNGNR